MSVIHKYYLEPVLTTLQLPAGAKVLTVGVQKSAVCLWAEVDLERGWQERQFLTIPTGVNVDLYKSIYIGTVFMEDLVFHVYENGVMNRS